MKKQIFTLISLGLMAGTISANEVTQNLLSTATSFMAEKSALSTAALVGAAVIAEPVITHGTRMVQRIWTGPSIKDVTNTSVTDDSAGIVSNTTKRRFYTAALTGAACSGVLGINKWLPTSEIIPACVPAVGAAIIVEPIVTNIVQAAHYLWTGPSVIVTTPSENSESNQSTAIQSYQGNQSVRNMGNSVPLISVNVNQQQNSHANAEANTDAINNAPIANIASWSQQFTSSFCDFIRPSDLTKRRIYTALLVAGSHYALRSIK